MSRLPFDPMNTAAMQAARAKKLQNNPDAPPLSVSEERALIEAASLANQIATEDHLLQGGSPDRPLTVKQASALVSHCLTETLPPTFFIQGEISNFRTYDRGHAFFTLKQAGAELPCVIWKESLARLKFRPKDGLAVIAKGNIKLYEPQSKLQLYVDTLFPQGAGALELAFRQLCDKLRLEGLFEPARKRPLPKLPERIVIITSRTGDVLHDVLTTAHRRFPGLDIQLYPVKVQGDQAAQEIASAISAVNAHNSRLIQSAIGNRQSAIPPIDLILLVRGGGSLEDLWAFNEEIVARAIVASLIPIATGIGHEPDTTIADLVADLRGATPTAVTELTIPDVRTLLHGLESHAAILTRDIRRAVERARESLTRLTLQLQTEARETLRLRQTRLDSAAQKIAAIEPRHAIAQGWRRVEDAQRKLADALHRRLRTARDTLARAYQRLERRTPAPILDRHRHHLLHLQRLLATALAARKTAALQRLAALETQLRVVSPQSILDRGFSITTDHAGKIVRHPSDVQKGDLLHTRLATGEILSTVGKPKQATLF